MSIHPTHTDIEIKFLIDGIRQLATNFEEWSKDYNINLAIGSIRSKNTEIEKGIESAIDHCLTKDFI